MHKQKYVLGRIPNGVFRELFKYVEPFVKEKENRKQAVKNARFHLNLKDL